MFIISRCLLGENCKYNGGNNRNDDVKEFSRLHSFVSVCPEAAGGLRAPRAPAEQMTGPDGRRRVRDRDGRDLTAEFERGASLSLDRVLRTAAERGEPVEGAILKGNSPSCGSGTIYDGTFSGDTVEGDGIFAGLLKARGIQVVDENGIKLLNCMENNDD